MRSRNLVIGIHASCISPYEMLVVADSLESSHEKAFFKKGAIKINNHKIIIIVVTVLLVSLSLNFFLYQKLDNDVPRPETQSESNFELTPQAITSFELFLDKIITDFKPTQYHEILQYKNHVMALPLEATHEKDLYDRQKLFVYKNLAKNVIIMLSVSIAKEQNIQNEWHASYSYLPKIFNNRETEYGKSFGAKYPDIMLSVNSFTYDNYYFTVTSFTENQEESVASEENVAFVNQLLTFLKKE